MAAHGRKPVFVNLYDWRVFMDVGTGVMFIEGHMSNNEIPPPTLRKYMRWRTFYIPTSHAQQQQAVGIDGFVQMVEGIRVVCATKHQRVERRMQHDD